MLVCYSIMVDPYIDVLMYCGKQPIRQGIELLLQLVQVGVAYYQHLQAPPTSIPSTGQPTYIQDTLRC